MSSYWTMLNDLSDDIDQMMGYMPFKSSNAWIRWLACQKIHAGRTRSNIEIEDSPEKVFNLYKEALK